VLHPEQRHLEETSLPQGRCLSSVPGYTCRHVSRVHARHQRSLPQIRAAAFTAPTPPLNVHVWSLTQTAQSKSTKCWSKQWKSIKCDSVSVRRRFTMHYKVSEMRWKHASTNSDPTHSGNNGDFGDILSPAISWLLSFFIGKLQAFR
jgi:hypothetical protein